MTDERFALLRIRRRAQNTLALLEDNEVDHRTLIRALEYILDAAHKAAYP